mmetsp:Transcript_39430/g.91449  ORF Transcript_39430/g.91449 Transcript_39430/m.91449 type:complete len:530 (+) Transcript_39430:70-1659(+)
MGCNASAGGSSNNVNEQSVVVAQRGTPFAELLAKGTIAVVRASYFTECLQRGVPFQSRAKIPTQAFIRGPEVVDLWDEYGYAFLVVVSHPWLSKQHPDPNSFHLPRLVRALEAFKKYHDSESWRGEKRSRMLELGGGVILDFCSLWQAPRTRRQEQLFKEGLRVVNIPYSHRDVTALRLTATPPDEARRYDDRGWTLLESTAIDGKAPSRRHGCGERNVLSCGSDFEPKGSTGVDAFEVLTAGPRKPPLTPQRFREELAARGKRAEARGLPLFSVPGDSPVVLERYNASFTELCNSRTLDFSSMHWGAPEAKELALALPFFSVLQKLVLDSNRLDSEASLALAAALPQCAALETLHLYGNQLGKGTEAFAELATALAACPALKVVWLGNNGLGSEGAAALADALPQLSALRTLGLAGNNLGQDAEVFAAFAEAIAACPFLEEVYLGDNRLGPQAAEALALALPHCSALRRLRLDSNRLGQGAEAFTTALADCGVLRELGLRGNSLSDTSKGALRTAWEATGKEVSGLSL